MSALAPYDLDGTTMGALEDLAALADSLDPTVASTARFLRAGAAVELLAFARLTGDEGLEARLVRTMRVPPADLAWAIERDLAACARRGALARQAESARVVLGCLAPDSEPAACAPRLRRVAGSERAGASAARLLLLDGVVRAAEAARRAPAAGAAAPLVEAGAALCASSRDGALRAACRAASGPDAQAGTAVARAVLETAIADLAALRRAAAGGDPLATLAGPWLDEARSRMGWLVLAEPLDAALLPDARPPAATAGPGPAPLALLVVGRSTVSVAVSPATVLGPDGALRLDERVGYALPGRRVLSLPADFRAVVEPVPEVTAALGEVRAALGEAIGARGEGGPAWVEDGWDVLGLVVDGRTTLVDLSRYAASARLAGFRRFALLGARDDGRLAALPAELGSTRDGPPPATPRLTVGPTETTLTGPAGASSRFQRRGELERLGQAAAALLQGEARVFAVEGRPMMPYAVVFPSIDAVVAAAPGGAARCHLLLPP